MKFPNHVLPTIPGLLLLVTGCAAPSTTPSPPADAAPTSAQAGNQTIVAIAAPSSPQPSLPQFLGLNDLGAGFSAIDQAKHHLISALFPQLATTMAGQEPADAVKSLTDPANLGEDAPPGVKDVGEVKKDMDAAPQKIAAIKYAASIGCVKGYPAIERAFLQFLDDPTEEVRFEAVKAIASISGNPCATCPKGSCCTPAIYKKLHDIVNKEKSPGCYVEYSDRIRRMARIAIHNCGPPPADPKEADPDKIEGPDKKPAPKKEKIEGPTPPPPAPGIKTARSDAKATIKKVVEKNDAEKKTGRSDIVQTDHDVRKSNTPQLPTANIVVTVQEPAPSTSMAAQWERVSVPFSNFGSHKEAFAVVNYLRARVQGARVFQSPRFRKEQISVQTFDWTDLQTVRPEVLGRMLKTLRIGQVSSVLRDNRGFHLVRVLKRRYPQPSVINVPEIPTNPIQQTGAVVPIVTPARAPKETPKPSIRDLPRVDESSDLPPLPKVDRRRIVPTIAPRRTAPKPIPHPTVTKSTGRWVAPKPTPRRTVPVPTPRPTVSKPTRPPTASNVTLRRTMSGPPPSRPLKPILPKTLSNDWRNWPIPRVKKTVKTNKQKAATPGTGWKSRKTAGKVPPPSRVLPRRPARVQPIVKTPVFPKPKSSAFPVETPSRQTRRPIEPAIVATPHTQRPARVRISARPQPVVPRKRVQPPVKSSVVRTSEPPSAQAKTSTIQEPRLPKRPIATTPRRRIVAEPRLPAKTTNRTRVADVASKTQPRARRPASRKPVPRAKIFRTRTTPVTVRKETTKPRQHPRVSTRAPSRPLVDSKSAKSEPVAKSQAPKKRRGGNVYFQQSRRPRSRRTARPIAVRRSPVPATRSYAGPRTRNQNEPPVTQSRSRHTIQPAVAERTVRKPLRGVRTIPTRLPVRISAPKRPIHPIRYVPIQPRRTRGTSRIRTSESIWPVKRGSSATSNDSTTQRSSDPRDSLYRSPRRNDPAKRRAVGSTRNRKRSYSSPMFFRRSNNSD